MKKTAAAQDLRNLVLIGCGKMGGALLERWAAIYEHAKFTVIEPNALPDHFKAVPNIRHFQNPGDAKNELNTADMLVLAVKPQVLDDICAKAAPSVDSGTVIVSIAAGCTIDRLARHFKSHQPIIRVMPNTPASVGKGMSVACAGKHATPQQKAWTHDLFSAAGVFEWLENEGLMDAVTALSGSGPAYVFYLIEMLAKSGESLGLESDTAMTLARQTVIGAASLAEFYPETAVAQLRENVTSPGGTTEAGLSVLMDGRAQKIIDQTLKASQERGHFLSLQKRQP